jgi:hypothetical protein
MGLLDDAIREHLDLKRRRGADPTEVEREEREVLGPVRRRGEPAPDDVLAQAPDDDLEHEPLPHPDDEWDDDWEDEPAAAAEPMAPPAGAFDHEQTRVMAPEPDPSRYSDAERELYAAQEPEQRFAVPEREPFVAPEPERYAPPEPEPHVAPEPEPYVAPAPEPHAAPEPYAAPEREPEPPAWAERQPGADHGHEPPVEEQTAEFSVEEAIDKEDQPPPAEGEEDVLEETPEFLQDTPDHDRLWFEQRPPRDFDFDG